MESGIQKTISGIEVQSNKFEFYLSRKWAPGGYLWVFPKGNNSANVGLGISGYFAKEGKSAQKFLDEFLQWKYPECSVLTTVVGGIPVDKTLKCMVADGLMLVGDAAHTVNPMTGGGISSGMMSGMAAAETAIELSHSKKEPTRANLNSYEKKWTKLRGKKHEKYYRIKEAIFRFDDDDLNRIADGIAAVKEEDRSLMKLFSIAVSKKPTLLIDVMRLFTGL
jgi:digeranylgeranylglycerophospholipid reductase